MSVDVSVSVFLEGRMMVSVSGWVSEGVCNCVCVYHNADSASGVQA